MSLATQIGHRSKIPSQVRRFLQTHPSFRTVPVLSGTDKLERDNMCTLLPHRSRSDGFFIAALSETE